MQKENVIVGIIGVSVFDLHKTLLDIKKTYKVINRNVFVFKILDIQHESYVLTFNVDSTNRIKKRIPDSLLFHRKKDYNVMFTINALNEVKQQDGNVEWQKYRNSVLTTNVDSNGQRQLKQINVQKLKVVNLNLI